MRLSKIAITLAATAALTAVMAAPAAAGTGPSHWCSDGAAFLEYSITDVVTVGFEVTYSPTNPFHQSVFLCYSTSDTNNANSVTGGAIGIDIWHDTGTATPGGYVALICDGDDVTSVGPLDCYEWVDVQAGVEDVAVGQPAGSTCLVALDGACQLYVPGVVVELNDKPGTPLLHVNTKALSGSPLQVDSPVRCVALLAGTC